MVSEARFRINFIIYSFFCQIFLSDHHIEMYLFNARNKADLRSRFGLNEMVARVDVNLGECVSEELLYILIQIECYRYSLFGAR